MHPATPQLVQAHREMSA